MNRRSRIPDWILLLAFCAFFFLWGLAFFGLIGADEPRYAQVAREMLARHDWITPTLSGSAWLEKPPLYYWQAMIAYSIFGVSDWAARIPSVIDATVLVFAVYWFLRRFRPGIELDGAMILVSAAGIVGFARAASMDMPLAASFAIAMLAWYAWFESGRRWLLALFYLALALGTLAKGPVALLLAAFIIAIFALVQSSPRIIAKTLWLPGIALFLLIAAPWYILAQIMNPNFFHVFIVEHNLARFGTNLYHHPEPLWYYLPVMLLGWIPWVIFVLVALGFAIKRFRRPGQDSLNEFLAIWILLIVAFFSISHSKLPGYILPALPAGILLLANVLRTKLNERPHALSTAVHSWIAGALVFASLNTHYLIVLHRVPWRLAIVPALVGGAVGIAVYLMLMRSGYRMLRFITLVPAVIALALGIRLGAQVIDQTLSARPVWQQVADLNPHHVPLALFLLPRETEFGLRFYSNQEMPRYEQGQVPEGEHIVVAAEGYARGVLKDSGRKPTLLAHFAAQRLDIFYVPAKASRNQ